MVNVDRVRMIVLTVIPVALAQRLMRDTGVSGGADGSGRPSKGEEHERNEDRVQGVRRSAS